MSPWATPLGDATPDGGDNEPDATPDVTPDNGDDVTPEPDNVAPDVAPEPQGDMTDPRWAEAATMRRRGDTVKAIAEHFGVSLRTVQRWKLPEPDSTKPVNGHDPQLTGARN